MRVWAGLALVLLAAIGLGAAGTRVSERPAQPAARASSKNRA